MHKVTHKGIAQLERIGSATHGEYTGIKGRNEQGPNEAAHGGMHGGMHGGTHVKRNT